MREVQYQQLVENVACNEMSTIYFGYCKMFLNETVQYIRDDCVMICIHNPFFNKLSAYTLSQSVTDNTYKILFVLNSLLQIDQRYQIITKNITL